MSARERLCARRSQYIEGFAHLKSCASRLSALASHIEAHLQRPAGQSAQKGASAVKLPSMLLDNAFVNEISPTGGLLRRIASAFASFARYAGGSLVNHPLPEVREIGNEWRG
jgi:hypothetical protein